MIADLFHCGHIAFLKQAREHGDYLIAGLCSDEDATSYKRKPILNLEERIKSVEGCKHVDEVIAHVPLKITRKFIEKHQIDVVIHGDDFDQEKLRQYYSVPMEMGIFKTVPYTKGISTTEIIGRIKNREIT